MGCACGLQDLVYDNACLANLRKHKAGQGETSASNGQDNCNDKEQHPGTLDVELAERRQHSLTALENTSEHGLKQLSKQQQRHL